MNEEILKAVLDWNPWIEGASFPKELAGFHRKYELEQYLQIPEIKVLEGARRTGKSTLIYQMIGKLLGRGEKVLYINFEDEVLKKYTLNEIISTFRERAPVQNLFVDEIQNCTDWVSFLRKAYDRKEIPQIWITEAVAPRRFGPKSALFVQDSDFAQIAYSNSSMSICAKAEPGQKSSNLGSKRRGATASSGSNSSLIKQEFASLLTGRNITINVYPLSFDEFLYFKSIETKLPFSSQKETAIKTHFIQYMDVGAFPAVVLRPVLQKELLINYFEDFIYKDIATRHEVNLVKIKELGMYLATNSAKTFSYRGCATALGMHPKTVMDYCSYFYEIFLFDELYKFDYSLKNQIGSDKKVYIIDTGLAGAVSFRFSEDHGRILENIVFNELRRRGEEIYFHKQKYECDFLIKKELKITSAIQVCKSLADPEVKQREIRGLLEAIQTYQLKEGLILTLDEEGVEEVDLGDQKITVKIMPVWKWLLS